MCNKSVDFLITKKSISDIRFSPLQGEAIKSFNLSEEQIVNIDTLYVWTGEKLLLKSEAWLWLIKYLGGVWYVIYLTLNLIPISLLDMGYDLIAKNRYKFFGKRESCRVPTAKERSRFID